MPEIEVKRVNKNFGTTKAVSEMSFSVEKGELFGLVGPDGAGKTTIFRLMSSLYVPDSGSITVAGHDTVADYLSIRDIVGYMPGRFSLYQDLTVEENLKFFASVFDTTIEANYGLIEDVYRMLEPYKKRMAGKLSGGMKQKLALCCALIHHPRILFLDEPTTGVDPVSRFEFWQMLKRLKDERITMVVSTPYMDEVKQCDRMAFVMDGRIRELTCPEDAPKSYGKKLWRLRGKGIYAMLLDARRYSGVDSCYSFGDSLHITLNNNQIDIENFSRYLIDLHHTDIEIEQIEPTIEDCYIKMVRNG